MVKEERTSKKETAKEEISQEEPTTKAEVVTEEDIEVLKKALSEAKAKAEANLAGWQRAQADFTNYKNRLEQEKIETIKWANFKVIESLMPVLDDLERALASLPKELAEVSWVNGIKLIDRKVRDILEAQGLSTIKAVGEPFDPRFHEAVRQAKGKEGIVIEEMQKGYMFRDRVIRPSQVAVGVKKETEPKEES
ncbi:MAG: nucleotide exchange factor GrpE [Chloroflexota bacterium]